MVKTFLAFTIFLAIDPKRIKMLLKRADSNVNTIVLFFAIITTNRPHNQITNILLKNRFGYFEYKNRKNKPIYSVLAGIIEKIIHPYSV